MDQQDLQTQQVCSRSICKDPPPLNAFVFLTTLSLSIFYFLTYLSSTEQINICFCQKSIQSKQDKVVMLPFQSSWRNCMARNFKISKEQQGSYKIYMIKSSVFKNLLFQLLNSFKIFSNKSNFLCQILQQCCSIFLFTHFS